MVILPLRRTLTKLQPSVRSIVNQHGQACQPISTATKTSNQPLSVLCINLPVLAWLPKLPPSLEYRSVLQWEAMVVYWAERDCSILGELGGRTEYYT